MHPDTKEFIAIFYLIIISPIGILLAYGNFEFSPLNFSLFAETFNKWPWFRVSIILTIITYLSSKVYYQKFKRDKRDQWALSFFITLIFMSIMFLLLYPGTEKLGLWSDSNGILFIFYLTLIHTVGFKLIADAEIERKKIMSKYNQ